MRLNRRDFPGARYSERVIQLGEGNFLRAFIDWQLDWFNEHQGTDAGVVVVRPRNRAQTETLNQQDGLYTTLLRGLKRRGNRLAKPGWFTASIVKSSLISSSMNSLLWRGRRRCALCFPTPPRPASFMPNRIGWRINPRRRFPAN